MTVIEFPNARDAELRRYAYHSVPVIEIASRMQLPEKVIRQRLKDLHLLALYRKKPYRPDDNRRMLELYDGGMAPDAIARVLKRDEPSVTAKLHHLLAARRQQRESDAAKTPRAFENIVDEAKHILGKAGYTPRDIDKLGLDGLMREANRRLHRWGMPQLGRKREWLWPQ